MQIVREREETGLLREPIVTDDKPKGSFAERHSPTRQVVIPTGNTKPLLWGVIVAAHGSERTLGFRGEE